MTVAVIIPPAPIVDPSDLLGADLPDVGVTAEIIAAVTAEIDGPGGWLQRALGEQTLELVKPGFGCSRAFLLPCPPLIDIDRVAYLDADGVEQEVDQAMYRKAGNMIWFTPSYSFPVTYCAPDAVKIRYRAGYDGTPIEEGGTGDVPAQAKRAVILSVQHMISMGSENLFLRAEEVDGVGRTEFTVSEAGSKIIRDAADRLLQGLRVYS